MPLVIRAPGRTRAGFRVADPVRLRDLAPTIAELAGVRFRSSRAPATLVPLMLGQRDRFAPRMALAESGGMREGYHANPRIHLPGDAGRWKMARRGRWKLIVVPGVERDEVELYDLEADPGELDDRAAAEPDVVAELRDVIDTWVSKRRVSSEGGAPRDREDGDGRVDPAELERLRALGYLL